MFKRFIDRYLVKSMSGMALGLFSTLLVGLIIKQIGMLIGGNIGILLNGIGSVASIATGAGIGIGVAHSLKAPNLVIHSSAVTGLIGAYASKLVPGTMFVEGNVLLIGPGDPIGAFLAAIIGVEIGLLISGKTKVDIVLTPLVSIVSGSIVGIIVGPPISDLMVRLGVFIVWATQLRPFAMGIIVSVVMGIILTLPISSAAISIMLGLSGLAGGAATVGCSAQMVGFAVASYRENKLNGLLSQGLGTSMLQMPNIVKSPRIWIPPIITSAILGPVSTILFKMENNPAGSGMGTSGLVGQLMTYQTMIDMTTPTVLLMKILILHIILPAIITLIISEFMRKKKWIKFGDMRLDI
jgi:uncharacterized membrane protein